MGAVAEGVPDSAVDQLQRGKISREGRVGSEQQQEAARLKSLELQRDAILARLGGHRDPLLCEHRESFAVVE